MGRRIYRIQPIEGLASESSSAAVIFGASLLGAPVSTTQVVASSLVGHRRWAWAPASCALVHRPSDRIPWLMTIPITAVLAMAAYGIWQLGGVNAIALVPPGDART